MRVGLIGLGIMGWRIGTNLKSSGNLDGVYNRSAEKSSEFGKMHGVRVFGSDAELARESDIIVTVLSNDSAVTSVVESMAGELRGRIVVDMSTISPTSSVALAKLVGARGGTMLDAPVIGSSSAAERKALVATVGGSKQVFPKVEGVLKTTCRSVLFMGDNGMGLYAKLVSNLLLGSYIASLSEALNFGLSAGLDGGNVEKILTKISTCASLNSELKVPKMLVQDYATSFSTRNMRKDLEIIQREAQNMSAIAPLTAMSLELYRMAENTGLAEKDFSSIAELYRKSSRRDDGSGRKRA